GKLAAKTGTIDFKDWYHNAFGAKTPWGDEDSPALVTEVETALERELSSQIMRPDAKPQVRKLAEGDLLVEQGGIGNDLFLVLDGVLDVEVDGAVVAQVGPGALLGERAILEGGARTSTLRAATRCKIAVAAPDDVDSEKLRIISEGHRREDG
ncbi:MAG TPA: cyclic nucleotide-binding domain-containing protein, partial [Acidimicrobiales bacterium]|nr:cyclic nucleotide-binding domain-containing protein [Acidimicrobiales bacterium]